MKSIEVLISIATALPQVTVEPHFEKQSFRVAKKIFATLDIAKQQATVKLSEADQDVFSVYNKEIIYPVPNKWGKQGWTIIHLEQVPLNLLTAIVKTAYRTVAPASLASLVNDSL